MNTSGGHGPWPRGPVTERGYLIGALRVSGGEPAPAHRPLPQPLALHRADGYVQILGSGQDSAGPPDRNHSEQDRVTHRNSETAGDLPGRDTAPEPCKHRPPQTFVSTTVLTRQHGKSGRKNPHNHISAGQRGTSCGAQGSRTPDICHAKTAHPT